MRVIRLYGILGKKFGRVHKLAVSTPAEAMRALMANYQGFEEFMCSAHEKKLTFRVVTGGADIGDTKELLHPAGQTIKIVPCVIGASAGMRTVLGIALIAASYFVAPWAAPFLFQSGAALALNGVSELLAPKPTLPDPPERDNSKPSYTFNGPVNTTAQGQAVALAYGRVLVGSAIISGGITIEELTGGVL